MWIWSLAVFIAVGFFLRFVALFNAIDYDEAYSFLTYASKPVLVAVGMYNLPNNHLFNSFLMWIMNHLTGGEPWWLRLPNLIAWILVSYQLFDFLKKKFSLELALLVLAALSCSSPFVMYSAMARGYCLHFCLILNVWFLLEAEMAEELEQRGLLPVVMALSFWTLPTSVYPIAGLMVYWAWHDPLGFKPMLKTSIRGALLTFFLYSPAIVYVVLNGTKTAKEDGIITSSASMGRYLWSIAAYFAESSFAVPAAILGLLFLAFPILYWDKDRKWAKLWVCLAVIPWVVIIATKIVPPFNRVWLWMGPFFFIFAFLSLQEIIGIFRKAPRWIVTVIAILVMGPMLIHSVQVVQNDRKEKLSGPDKVSEALKKVVAPGDFVAFYGGYLGQLEYWEYLGHGNDKYLPMKRYPVLGSFKFYIDRLHAEPAVLRKDLAQLQSVKVWAFVDQTGSNSDLEKVISSELPAWQVSKIEDSVIVVGEKKLAAFRLEKALDTSSKSAE
jgi:hypothetical protein